MQTSNEGDLVDDKISPEATIVSAVLDVVASFLEGTEGSEIISSISPIINAIAPIIFNDEEEYPEYDFGSESDNQVPWEKSQSTKPASVKGSTPPYVQDTTKTSTPPIVEEPIKRAVPPIVENTQNKIKGNATGGANEVEESLIETKSNSPNGEVYINQEKLKELGEEKYKALYPDEIAGVKRGKEMSMNEVIQKGVNPSYEYDIENDKRNRNCNSCVAAYEYSRRGYSVNAGATYNNSKCEELSHNGFDLWVDPSTEKIAEWTEIHPTKENSFELLNGKIKQGERYEIAVYMQMEDRIDADTDGHVVVIERMKNGELILFDPQEKDGAVGNLQVKKYLDSRIDNPEVIKHHLAKYIRIDNKRINPYYEKILIP